MLRVWYDETMKKMTANDFYREFHKDTFFKNDKKEQLKRDYFNDKVIDNTIYKFIPFDNNEELNESKMFSLENNMLWFAPYFLQKDGTELEISLKLNEVAKKTSLTIDGVKFIIESIRELNDICCLTTCQNERMWQEYANSHQGICLEFEIIDFEFILPIFYCNKKKIDYTDSMIQAIKAIKNNTALNSPDVSRVTFEPCVAKDKVVYSWENEIRLMSGDSFGDPNDKLGGRVAPDKKQMLGYPGRNYPHEYCKLKLKKIIIGNKLRDDLKNRIVNFEKIKQTQIIYE